MQNENHIEECNCLSVVSVLGTYPYDKGEAGAKS